MKIEFCHFGGWAKGLSPYPSSQDPETLIGTLRFAHPPEALPPTDLQSLHHPLLGGVPGGRGGPNPQPSRANLGQRVLSSLSSTHPYPFQEGISSTISVGHHL
jgi:hypothetical protein